jgi:hypothetical protein
LALVRSLVGLWQECWDSSARLMVRRHVHDHVHGHDYDHCFQPLGIWIQVIVLFPRRQSNHKRKLKLVTIAQFGVGKVTLN